MRIILCSFLFISFSNLALADGESVAAPGAQPSLDSRLPPVLPGDTVKQERKHRVITTVGPVPVSPPAEAPGLENHSNWEHRHGADHVDVIVDGRKGEVHRDSGGGSNR